MRPLWLAALALLVMAAGPAAEAIRSNPALARIARRHPARAAELLDQAERALAAPAGLQPRTLLPMPESDRTLLADNPVLRQVYGHNPSAALGLLQRIKAAGGT